MNKITIYTDGSCWNKNSGGDGIGAWASIIIYPDKTEELTGKLIETTNNRAEMLAAIEGLKSLKETSTVDLYSDSAYLINCFNNKWYKKWQKNGWINSNREPVLNRDLWEELLELNKKHTINFLKVKGHSDNVHNNRCDELASKTRLS